MSPSLLQRLLGFAFLLAVAASPVAAQPSQTFAWQADQFTNAGHDFNPYLIQGATNSFVRIPCGTGGASLEPVAVDSVTGMTNTVTLNATVTNSGGAGYVSYTSTTSLTIPASQGQGALPVGTTVFSQTAYSNCYIQFTATVTGYATVVLQSPVFKFYTPVSTAPSTPGNLTVSGQTSSGFTLGWSASNYASGTILEYYQIALTLNGTTTYTLVPGTTTGHVFTSMAPGSYAVSVVAIDFAENYSTPATATAIVDNTPPSVPSSLGFNSIGTNGFSVYWPPSTDYPTGANVGVGGYTVVVTGGSTNATYNVAPNANGPGGDVLFAASSLAPNTTYTVSVTAYDNAGNVSGAKTGSVTTTSTTVAAPTGLSATPTTGGFTLSWSDSGSNVTLTGYNVYVTGNSTPIATITGNPPATTVNITDLSEGTSYSVYVVAVAGSLTSPASSSISVQPGPGLTAPTGLTAISFGGSGTNSQFTLIWNASNDNTTITNYVITCNGTPYNATHDSSGNLQLFYTLTGLNSTTLYSLTVEAVDSANHTATSSTLQVIFPGQLVPFPTVTPPTVSGSSIVGSLGGSFSVDSHGAANYSVPIQIAPGRGSMVPHVSLDYDSASGNGVVGLGWRLSTGLPGSITWGRTILARDGIVQGVTFNPAVDKLYLDGKRLILVSGTYGMPGSTYRTEVDSFQQIVATGSGNQIATFVSTDKQGNTYTFGTLGSATDGYQLAGNETTNLAYAYALKQVQDTLGNNMVLSYLNQGGGEYLLSRIAYTGFGSTPGDSHVDFVYDGSRPDQTTTYLANRSFNHRGRLSWISSSTLEGGTDTVSSYYLLQYWALSGDPLGNQRSRLWKITPYLADPQTNALYGGNPTIIGWQDYNDTTLTQAYTITIPPPSTTSVEWGDFNNSGSDISLLNSTTAEPQTLTGDINGDGAVDTISVMLAAGGCTIGVNLAGQNQPAPPTIPSALITSYFQDPGYSSFMLLGDEGQQAINRITIADFDGDGRDDILIHGMDGTIHLFLSRYSPSRGNYFAGPIDGPFMGGQGQVTYYANPVIQLWDKWIDLHYFVRAMPCDLTGYGKKDYVCITYNRVYGANSGGVPASYFSQREMSGVIFTPTGGDTGTFGPEFGINQFVPEDSSVDPNHNGSVPLQDINCGAFVGDFNGDGLSDFLVLDNKGIQGARWLLYINQGLGTTGTPQFMVYPAAIPNTVVLPVAPNDTVNTYYNPMVSSSQVPGEVYDLPAYFNVGNSANANFMGAFEGAAGSMNLYVMDVNHDGMSDLVWYVAETSGETLLANTSPEVGWWAMLSTGNYAPGSPAFVGPVQLSYLNAVTPPSLTHMWDGSTNVTTFKINHSIDYDGDGHPDYFIELAQNGQATSGGTVYTSRGSSGAAVFGDLANSFTDGLGRTTTVAYKAAKDPSIYTAGAAVSYPIKEFHASNPVVSNIYEDTGGSSTENFSYQYSGNRLDLSGRGNLGFHSFVTLDAQTNLFKYQFLTQSFPMTGLTQREQTYRYWTAGGNGNFRLIDSHDNTVVFDQVTEPGTGLSGTLYPFISQAVETRWEDDGTNSTADATYTISLSSAGTSDQAESIFPTYSTRMPTGSYATITAQSWFDNQPTTGAPPTTLPGSVTGYNASDFNSATGASTATGTLSFSVFSQLPGYITYGNLVQLKTNYGGSLSTTVNTTYQPPTTGQPLTGLPWQVATSVTSPGFGTQTAPVKTYTYQGATPLVATETTSGGASLTFTNSFGYSATGALSSKSITGSSLVNSGAGSTSITSYAVPNGANGFDGRYDQPISTQDAYQHTTSISYGNFFGKPISITDVNGATTSFTYDGMGREVNSVDPFGLATTTTYAWDSSQSVSGPSAANGLTLQSVYSETVHPQARPPVTTYYDRLGRPIRTIKQGFNSQQIVTDTVYNVLGQVVATSLPYDSGAAGYWTITSYDPLGRPVQVTAPNGTTTATKYVGLAKQVTVTPSGGTAQTNSTLVNAKGETVAVWNADNVPTFTDMVGDTSTAPSIAYGLDGFGLMRTTSLLGQSAQVSASYDSLNRQIALNDPDKGNWSYVNSALGYVLGQTDARGDVTNSVFDFLGRPLTRTTTEPSGGPVETDSWFYYDSSANAANNWVAATAGTGGWIGALQQKTSVTANAPGYANPGTSTTYYYDGLGRPQFELHNVDSTWFYTYKAYDTSNRLSLEQYYWRPAGHEAASNMPYTWSSFGLAFAYDPESYLTTIQDTTVGARTWWAAHPTQGYDYLDRPVLVQKGSAYWTQRTYNPLDGTLTAITTGPTQGSGTIQNLSVAYDGLGNVKSRSDTLHGTAESFGYDILNRLTSSADGSVSYFQNGNISQKTDISGNLSSYVYGAAQPHAVSSAWGYSLGYDADGNLVSRTKTGETWNFKWAGFDAPRWMAKTASSITNGNEFLYDADRSRVIQLQFSAIGSAPSNYTWKRVYGLGPNMEIDYTNTASSGPPMWQNTTARVYVTAPDGIVGTAEFTPTSSGSGISLNEQDKVYHYDHIGSIEAITPAFDTSGKLATTSTGATGLYGEDAWGLRRNPISLSGPPTSTDTGGISGLSPRGFTSHEMLDDLTLVHMNGRIYDPLIGRFLSADKAIQSPLNLQSYNRYSYVMNNPLTMTDPTGWYSILGLEFTDGGGVSGFFQDSASYAGSAFMGGVGDNAVAGYKAGEGHMELAMTEISNAHSAGDVGIGVLGAVASVGDAVGTVMAVTPEGKAESAAVQGVEKVAVTAERAAETVAARAEGSARTAESRLEGVVTGVDSKVPEKVDVHPLDPDAKPYGDITGKSYEKGSPDKVVIDHLDNRAAGGHPTDPANLDPKSWEANSRKAGFEGNLAKDRENMIKAGMDPADVDKALAGEKKWIKNDAHPVPVDPEKLKKLPQQ